MIEGRLNVLTAEAFPTAIGEVELISAATWFRVTRRGLGFELSYRRPVRVTSSDGTVALAIRDHVMIARALALFAGLWFTIWRLLR